MNKCKNIKRQGLLLIGSFLLSSLGLHAQQADATISPDSIAPNSKEVKNRNVMLGAGDSTTPRTLNIGLPFSGDILINENDLPVVYTYWTQIPTTAWRYDSSLGNMGVMSFAEGALQFGKVGYIVTSWDREPSRKFRAYANFNASSEGNMSYDANVTAPIGKDGWGFSLSVNETYNRGSMRNYEFAHYQDRYESFKAGIFKKYKKGSVSLLYKYAREVPVTGSYTPYRYLGNGKTEGYNGFDPGRDCYIISSGLFPYVDFETGQERFAKVGEDSVSENLTHAIYFYGDHKFKKGFKLKYSTMYMHSKAALTMQYPISMSLYDTNTFGSPLYKEGSVTPYDGPIQMVASQYYPQVGINTFQAKAELTKKVNLHNLRLGLTYQYYNAPEKQQTGTYLQTVENNPQILSFIPAYEGMTQTFTLGGTGAWKRSYTSKLALFLSDDFTLNRWLSGGVGGRIELQNGKTHVYPYPNTNRADNPDAENFVYKDKNKINYVLTANLLAKATKQFGFVAEATYNRYFSAFLDYADDQKDPDTEQPITNAIRNVKNDHYESVLNLGGGVYWNIGSYLSLVSKVTYISKCDIVTSENVFDGATQYSVYPITYDINTLGWTTDVVSTFGNFNLHFLFTLQNPQYKNYDYSYKGTQYSYSDKVIPTLSKTLIEIDPSYYLFGRDVRVWASFRYFGKQYGNKPNTISYKGWWETFAGIDYHVNRYIDLKLKLCNVLNQKGVSGSLVGGEQITDESQMIGQGFVAENIRPRALEISASIKF